MKLSKKILSLATFIPKRIKEISKDEVKENILNYYEGKWNNFAKDYLACGIGETLLSAPVWAFLETWGARAVSEVLPFVHQYGVELSKTQRSWWAFANLVALGYVSHKGRGAFRWFFKYDDSQEKLVDSLGHEKKVLGHDGKLGLAVGTLSSFAGYLLGKNYGFSQVASQTGLSPVGNYTIGAANGLANDVMQECLDLSHPKRLPEWMKEINKQEKNSLIGLMILGSFLSVKLIYGSYDAVFPVKDLTKKEIKLNKLERFSLDNYFPEFKKGSLTSYVLPADGVKVDTPKYFSKN